MRVRYRSAFHRPELVFGASLAIAACAVAREAPTPPGFAIGEGAQGTDAGAPSTSAGGSSGTGGGSSGTTASGGSSGSAGNSAGGGSGGSTGGDGSGGSSGTTASGGSSGTSGGNGGNTSGSGGTSGTAGTAGTSGGNGGSTSGTGGAESGAGGGGGSAGTSSAGTSSAGTGGTPMSGQVLFSDDFESGEAADWFPSADPSAWSVVTDGTNVYEQAPPQVNSDRFSSAGDGDWTDVSVEARVKVLAFNGSSSSYFAGVYARVQSASTYYSFALRSDGKVSIRKSSSNLGSSVDAGITEGEWYDIRFVARGSTLTGYVNGMQVTTVTDSSITSGAIGVGTRNTSARFDDVVVTVP